MRSPVALLSAAVLAIAGVLVTPGVATASDPVGRVLSVAADPGPFVVDGFAGQAQSMITVTIDQPVYQAGACGRVEWEYTGVEAVLERTSGGPLTTVKVDLPHVGATGTVQTYRGPWRIASTRTGTWTLAAVVWCDMTLDSWDQTVAGDLVSVDPRMDLGVTATVTVVGRNAPTASFVRIPSTVPYRDPNLPRTSSSPRQWARYTYRTAAGAPIVGATVLWGTEYACWGDPMPPSPGGTRWPYSTLHTDARGQVTVLLDDTWGPGQTCASLLGPPAVPGGDLGTRALVRQDWPYPRHFYNWVSAAAATTAVRVNRTLTVIGSASPSSGVVRLQRLVGRTWRTVASARIRASGRYTVIALVTTLGCNHYRVVALNGDATLAPTPSRTFVVIGTRR